MTACLFYDFYRGLLPLGLRSSVKVKYKGHNFQKITIMGALVFHIHSLFSTLPDKKTFALYKLKVFADINFSVAQMLHFFFF